MIQIDLYAYKADYVGKAEMIIYLDRSVKERTPELLLWSTSVM